MKITIEEISATFECRHDPKPGDIEETIRSLLLHREWKKAGTIDCWKASNEQMTEINKQAARLATTAKFC